MEWAMTTTQPIKSFVSYSWTVEKDTKIVTELSKLCQERGIELIRDETAMKHGDQIHQFMEKLTGSEHIITIFSKPYFESQWCMFELLTIYQKGNFKERTHPIIADGCDLQSPAYRLSCSDFWAEKYITRKEG